MGLFTHSTKVPDDLRAQGISGHATVQHVTLSTTSNETGTMNERKADQVATGELAMGRTRLELQVQLPGRPPYSTSVHLPVPQPMLRYMTPGNIVPVLVDPRKADRVAIDWDGQFEQATLSQLVGADRVLGAEMRYDNIDVDRLTQMQEAQRAADHRQPVAATNGQSAASASAAPDQLEQLRRLGELRDSGVLTESEFQAQKLRLLSQ